uniref:Uncharacterized protein n=1 Tax=Arundo donax TaxID=35708 RepID=A0A0A9FUI4_ARUDO
MIKATNEERNIAAFWQQFKRQAT